MPYRYDLVEIKSPTVDQNGYLVADAFPTRVGVFKYVKADGTVTRELRAPEEVFSPASLESLKHRPIVDNHPDGGPMDAGNTRRLSVGHVGEQVEAQGQHVKANVVVTDRDMIAKMMGKNGEAKRELSCGYTADTIEESGVWKGQPYDSKQTNIVYNHLASVWKGRAGATAQIHLDGEDALSESFESLMDAADPSDDPTPPREDSMTIKLKRDAVSVGEYRQDAFDIQFEDKSEPAINTLASKLDEANAQVRVLQDKYDGEKGEHTKTKASKDQLEEDAKKKSDGPDPVELNRLAAARADVMGVAAHVGLTGVDEHTDEQIKAMVVQKHNPDLKMDGLDPLIVEGRYDAICDGIRQENKNLDSLAALKRITTPDAESARREDSDDAGPRERFVRDMQGLHELTPAQIKEKWAAN